MKIGEKEFKSRLFTGTGKFGDKNDIPKMLAASGSEMITVALRRMDFTSPQDNILKYIPKTVTILPNTSGARNAEEAIRIARIAREAGCGNFIKIEIITDMKYLMPDNQETIIAAQTLVKEGFTVLPYISQDLITARKLEDLGVHAIMPLASPIGSNQGIKQDNILKAIIDVSNVPVIIDAGIGKPSDATKAMEIGADAVLVNTAITTASDPVKAGEAFKHAVIAGRIAYEISLGQNEFLANASSPLSNFIRNL